jgi:hypothetical protein
MCCVIKTYPNHGTVSLKNINRWRGHIDPCWDLLHRELAYVHEDFNSAEDLSRWQSWGFEGTRFTGDLYDMRFAEPFWMHQVRQELPMINFSWAIYRMTPGDVLPQHADTYRRFCEIHGVIDTQHIQRYVVFMEDWQSGHYFEIDGTPVVSWKAGDWVMWRGCTPHLAANVGSSPRYTMQLTGTIDI